MQTGDSVTLYYHASEHTAFMDGKIQEVDSVGVSILARLTGDLVWFPHTSVQRMVLSADREDDRPPVYIA
jgi:hypothetical protein